jgi:hypothetical protein
MKIAAFRGAESGYFSLLEVGSKPKSLHGGSIWIGTADRMQSNWRGVKSCLKSCRVANT